MLRALVVLSILGVALCRPDVNIFVPTNFSTKPLSPADREWLARQVPMSRAAYPTGFHFMYLARNGHMVEDTRPATGDYLELVGSPQTPRNALYEAGLMLGKMLRHARPGLFNRIARHPGSGLGLFSAQEKVTIYPEAAHLRGPPECEGRCDGSCSNTCTFDGRKFADIPGVTIGSRSFVLMENVLCTSHDPYRHHDNIAVHEFAHSVHRLGLLGSEQRQLEAVYANARQQQLWAMDSYAMGNTAEYFAEGTGAYFLVNLNYSTGGMTSCHSNQKCSTEQEEREFLRVRDPNLWTLLTAIYTRGDATIASGLTICPQTSG